MIQDIKQSRLSLYIYIYLHIRVYKYIIIYIYTHDNTYIYIQIGDYRCVGVPQKKKSIRMNLFQGCHYITTFEWPGLQLLRNATSCTQFAADQSPFFFPWVVGHIPTISLLQSACFFFPVLVVFNGYGAGHGLCLSFFPTGLIAAKGSIARCLSLATVVYLSITKNDNPNDVSSKIKLSSWYLICDNNPIYDISTYYIYIL